MTRTRTFTIHTWGCQMNELDSRRLAGHLRINGWVHVEDEESADLVILNTCSVREKAVDKFISRLGRLRRWKGKGKGRKIVVAGCIAQQQKKTLLERAPYIDLVIGPGQVEKIVEHLENRDSLATGLTKTIDYDYTVIDRENDTSGMVTIIEGCDRFCSFCIVPFTRGRERSRTVAEITEEVEALVGEGHSTLLLLGQTINAYQCPETGTTFSGLLRQLSALPGLACLRFVTSHPAIVTDDLIEVIRENARISRFLHLPAQSGSSTILEAMNRGYTREDYLGLTDKIQARIPEVAISSDFIIGFPGESEEDHALTIDLLRRVRFASIYAFAYSPRPGTRAEALGDPVSHEIKKRRLNEILEVQKGIQLSLNQALVGRTLPVFIDGESKLSRDQWAGRSHCNRAVNLEDHSLAIEPDSWYDVLITRAFPHSLLGKVVESRTHPGRP